MEDRVVFKSKLALRDKEGVYRRVCWETEMLNINVRDRGLDGTAWIEILDIGVVRGQLVGGNQAG